VTLDGKVLWQIGKPDPRHGLLTSDTPFQVHDLDGDGKCEVFLMKDFKLQVLDGMNQQAIQTLNTQMTPTMMAEAMAAGSNAAGALNAGDSTRF
jgi:hypothetical protein